MKLSAFVASAAAATLALSSAPLAAQENTELVVVYSAGIDGLLVDDKDDGLARCVHMLDERLGELARDFGSVAFPASGVQWVYELLTRPACLRIGSDAAGAPRFQLTLIYPDTSTLQRRAAELRELTGSGHEPAPTPLGPLTIATDTSANRSTLRLAIGAPMPESFDFARAELPAEVLPAFYATCDGRSLGELIEPLLAAQGGRDGEQLWKLLEFAGFVGEHAARRTWAMGYAQSRGVAVSRIENYVPLAQRNGSFVADPLNRADLVRIPADATFASLSQLRPSGLLAMLDHFGPGASAGVLGMLHGMTGVDLEETLEQLGPTAGVYWSRSGGGGLMSSVAFIESSHPEEVARAIDGLALAAEGLAQAKAQGRFAQRTWDHAGVTCRTWTFPGLPIPLEITYAVLPDVVLATLTPQAMTGAIDQLSSETFLFDHRPESVRGLMGFSFFDTPYFLDRGYGTASFMASGLSNALRSPYDVEREPGVLMPSLTVLAEGAKQTVFTSRVEGDDLVCVGSFDRSWVVHGTALAGSPLARGYAGIAGLGIFSSVAIPNLMGARQSANESAAIATLRSLASAQAQFQASSAVDVDRDGAGEHGFFGELSGGRSLRGVGATMNPPVLSSAFRALEEDGNGTTVVRRSGYLFQVWLPGRGGRGIAEAMQAQRTGAVDPELSELYWCVYAWPAEPRKGGTRVFFINQNGDLLQFDNAGGVYAGTRASGGRQPSFDAAFTRREDMTSDRALNARGQDGNHWTVVGN